MEALQFLEARISWWLAYADSCINADEALARCQGFWSFIGIILGIVCVAALTGVIAKFILQRRRTRRGTSDPAYRKAG